MTISKERIQAEVMAETKRIEAWNASAGWHRRGPALNGEEVRSLANHSVRNRLQVELGIAEFRAKGHTLGQAALHHPANCRVTGGCYLCQAEKLEAAQ